MKDKFLKHVKKLHSHWIWIGAVSGNGYGAFRLTKMEGAHRAAWIIFNGKIPKNTHVLHKNSCHLPLCVNPNHLYLGTHKDNMADIAELGIRKGERNSNAKLTNSDVLKIRKLSKTHTQLELAKMFNVKEPAIWKIINNHTHVN